jgi:hypothetical protein
MMHQIEPVFQSFPKKSELALVIRRYAVSHWVALTG